MKIGMKLNSNISVIDQSLTTRNIGRSAGMGNPEDIQLREKCRDLEALFLTQLIKAMEKTIPQSTLFGSQNSLPGMLFSSTMGQAIAERGGLGLAEKIYRSLDPEQRVEGIKEEPSGDYIDTLLSLKNIFLSEHE